MIKVALFDYDGTLGDSDVAHLACWNQTLGKYGITVDLPFYISNFVGNLSAHIAEHCKKDHPQITASVSEIADDKDARFEQWIASKTIPTMPGVREMLAFLAEKGIRSGIVTGSPLAAMQKSLEENGIAHYFETMVTRESVALGKPAPDGYLYALRQMGSPADEAVSFEDTGVGVRAARAAGMTAVAIPSIYTASHDFSAANMICRDMSAAQAAVAKMLL